MAEERLLAADGAVVSHFLANEAEGVYAIRHRQDVAPILAMNERLRNEGNGMSPSRELRRVASIPLVVYHQWLKEGFDALDPDSWPELRRRLRGDYGWLRTSSGSI
jgi:hypothetical protein